MSNQTKKVSNKIFFLVGIQITVIIISFLVLEFFESQKVFSGNSVNIAGKNRFLTEMVLNTVKDYYIGGKLTGDPISALAIYEKNLELLKTGGTQNSINLSSLPKEFHGQWENIHNLYLDYKTKIQSFVKSDSANYKETKLVEISDLADKLVEQNDILTVQLALDSQNLTTMLIWLQVSFAIINIGTLLCMIIMVYNALKKRAEQLTKIEKDTARDKKYGDLYDGMPDLCRTINDEGIIMDCNMVYANSLGYSKEEVIGKSIFEHVAEKSLSNLHDSLETWKNKGLVKSREIWFKRKDGSSFPTLLNATKLIDENGKMSSNTVIRDMSDIYDIKKELEEQKIKRLSAIGEMAARLAHDLRNPLSILKNTIEILKIKYSNNALDSVSFNTHCTKMDNAVSRVSHQIDDVLDFVRISPLNLSEVSLPLFVRNICEKISHSKNIEIELPNNYYYMTCDEKKLEVVLTNLLVNAVEAIGDKTGKITIKFIKTDENIRIEISDTGSGIPENIKDKIFEPLFTTKQKGTGLGLVSCKNIIEQHRGSITVKNNPTTFTILLPTNLINSEIEMKSGIENDPSNIQLMRYYEEALAQSARNYAFTGDKKWEKRYKDLEPESDELLKNAIKNADKKDKKFFVSMYEANHDLVEVETTALELVNNGQASKAVKILESNEYERQRKILRDGLAEHINATEHV